MSNSSLEIKEISDILVLKNDPAHFTKERIKEEKDSLNPLQDISFPRPIDLYKKSLSDYFLHLQFKCLNYHLFNEFCNKEDIAIDEFSWYIMKREEQVPKSVWNKRLEKFLAENKEVMDKYVCDIRFFMKAVYAIFDLNEKTFLKEIKVFSKHYEKYCEKGNFFRDPPAKFS